MDVITIQTEAFQLIIDKINEIEKKLSKIDNTIQPQETLLDVKETSRFLKISTRTLQSLRNNKLLAFSQINGKIYFKTSDIEAYLNRHYIKATDSQTEIQSIELNGNE